MSAAAAGDALALVASSAGLSNAVPFIVCWAILAPPLGAFERSRTLAAAAKAPAPAILVAVPSGCVLQGVFQAQMPELTSAITMLLVMGLLLEGWRITLFGLKKINRAFDNFILAVVDEDGGDDDF